MSEAPSKREQLKEERRRQILEAAVAVFTQKGFHAANVSDVAAQAGVSQGTIYWYFESKEELFTAAILSLFEDFDQVTLATLNQCPTAADKLRALGQIMKEFADSAGALFMRFLEFWAANPERAAGFEVWTGLLSEYKDMLVQIIDEGVQAGELRPVDADSLVWAMLAAYDGLAAYVMFMPDLDLGRASETFIETLLTGLQVERKRNDLL